MPVILIFIKIIPIKGIFTVFTQFSRDICLFLPYYFNIFMFLRYYYYYYYQYTMIDVAINIRWQFSKKQI